MRTAKFKREGETNNEALVDTTIGKIYDGVLTEAGEFFGGHIQIESSFCFDDDKGDSVQAWVCRGGLVEVC